MNIAYQCSNSFVGPLLVSIKSLLVNGKYDSLKIFILSKDFSKENLASVNELIHSHGYKVDAEIIRIPDFEKDYGMKTDDFNGKWTPNSYVRLFLSDLLPKEIEKVLYLDSDVLILKDLNELFDTNLEGYNAAACCDFLSEEYYKFLTLTDKDSYYNSGVILFNLKECRASKYVSKVVEEVNKRKGFVFFVEQSIFNIVENNKILKLDAKYNLNTIALTLSEKQIDNLRKPINTYSSEEIKKAKEDTAILHMTTFFLVTNRAWFKKTNYKRKEVFREYALLTEHFSFYEDKRSIVKKGIDLVLKIIPKSITCYLVGIYYRKNRIRKYIKYSSNKMKGEAKWKELS